MILTIGAKVKDDKDDFYVLDDVLGQGGFGCVYKAHRETDGFVVAVKTLSTSFPTEAALTSFQKEINQTKLIESDNVIKYLYVHDGAIFNDYPPYIIMEYANGGTLKDVINAQKKKGEFFEEKFLISTIKQLSEGMIEISKHIVHRDIKPENILIKDGKLKISDFGLSKISNESTQQLTLKGYGTVEYVAPEGWQGGKNTIQMDIYSMGIVFYELLTLSYPYDVSGARTNDDLRDAHLYEAVKNPTLINPNSPPKLVSTILRMLEKATQNRYKNWEDILSSLESDMIYDKKIGAAVNEALKARNSLDIKTQEEKAASDRKCREKENLIKLVMSQYDAKIFSLIETFCEQFNNDYAKESKFRVVKNKPMFNDRFTYEVLTPSLKKIIIETEVIFAENHQRKIPVDRIFGGSGYRMQSYIPQCNKRNVLAWSQVKDDDGIGFNILLLESKESMYGDWYILTNTNSALVRKRRNEPFGFSIKELPEEIGYLNVTHIYDLDLSGYDDSVILAYLTKHV